MRFKSLIATSLLLSGFAFAADPAYKPPAFTIEQESKLQALLIKQLQLRLQLQTLQDQYKQSLQQLQTIQAEGDKTLNESLKATGADPAEFTTNVDDGKFIITRK